MNLRGIRQLTDPIGNFLMLSLGIFMMCFSIWVKNIVLIQNAKLIQIGRKQERIVRNQRKVYDASNLK